MVKQKNDFRVRTIVDAYVKEELERFTKTVNCSKAKVVSKKDLFIFGFLFVGLFGLLLVNSCFLSANTVISFLAGVGISVSLFLFIKSIYENKKIRKASELVAQYWFLYRLKALRMVIAFNSDVDRMNKELVDCPLENWEALLANFVVTSNEMLAVLECSSEMKENSTPRNAEGKLKKNFSRIVSRYPQYVR